MTTKYYVVDGSPGDDTAAFFGAFHTMLDEISQHGFRLEASDRRESATQIRVQYKDDKNRVTISFWDDYLRETRYLQLDTEDASIARLIERKISESLPILSNKYLIECAQKEMTRNPKILYKVAFSAPTDYEQANCELILDAIESDTPSLRAAGAVAAGLLGWPQFKPQLEEAYEEEGPGEAKLAMEQALAMFK